MRTHGYMVPFFSQPDLNLVYLEVNHQEKMGKGKRRRRTSDTQTEGKLSKQQRLDTYLRNDHLANPGNLYTSNRFEVLSTGREDLEDLEDTGIAQKPTANTSPSVALNVGKQADSKVTPGVCCSLDEDASGMQFLKDSLLKYVGDQCLLTGETVIAIFQRLNQIMFKLDNLKELIEPTKRQRRLSLTESLKLSDEKIKKADNSRKRPRTSLVFESSENENKSSRNHKESKYCYQPNEIVFIISLNKINSRRWSNKKATLYSLSSLLRAEIHSVDLKGIEKLNNDDKTLRLLLIFESKIIPQMLMRMQKFLASYSIFVKRVFRDEMIRPLLNWSKSPQSGEVIKKNTNPYLGGREDASLRANSTSNATREKQFPSYTALSPLQSKSANMLKRSNIKTQLQKNIDPFAPPSIPTQVKSPSHQIGVQMEINADETQRETSQSFPSHFVTGRTEEPNEQTNLALTQQKLTSKSITTDPKGMTHLLKESDYCSEQESRSTSFINWKDDEPQSSWLSAFEIEALSSFKNLPLNEQRAITDRLSTVRSYLLQNMSSVTATKIGHSKENPQELNLPVASINVEDEQGTPSANDIMAESEPLIDLTQSVPLNNNVPTFQLPPESSRNLVDDIFSPNFVQDGSSNLVSSQELQQDTKL